MLFFRPRTRPKTFLQCLASEQRESKAKHCRDVLGSVLGRKNNVQNLSFSILKMFGTSYESMDFAICFQIVQTFRHLFQMY